jgi:sugar O-acyltransferase (sialic acid O-acetyltransferase NeuD family)
MKKAIIVGTAAFAEVARVYLDADSPYTVEAFAVHDQFIGDRRELLGLPIVSLERLVSDFPAEEFDIFVALGFSKVNKARTALFEEIKAKGYRMLTYINSNVSHVGHFEIGENCFIFENNVIQPFVRIGDNTILWSGNHVGHHSRIGKNCFIASHVVISGQCEIGNNCFIGVNATLRDGVKIADECVIGAGALILKDTVERGVYKVDGTEAAKIRSDQLRNF